MNQPATAAGTAMARRDREDFRKYLTFVLASETYGLSIRAIREIVEYGEVTPIPMMPDFIAGAINLRGRAVPVIDLATRLGGVRSEVSRRTCIVVVELELGGEALTVGVIVDAVSRVLDLLPEQIERAPSFGGHVRTDFIEGMGKVNDGEFVILLDIAKVLSMEDLKWLAQSRPDQSM